MSISLKCKLSKLRYKGELTWKEYSELIKKLDGHDKQVREDAIEEFVEFANTMPTVEEEDGEIRPMWLEEMAQKLKEQKEVENV